MNEQLNKILYEVAADTLKKLAFIFSFPEDELDGMTLESSVAARVSFTGPFSGTLVLKMSAQVLLELSANMLGVDEEEMTPDQQHDALKETINVICGNILPAIGGKEAVFNIDVPGIIGEGESEMDVDATKAESIVRLSIDDEQCDLLLFIDGEIPSTIPQEVGKND